MGFSVFDGSECSNNPNSEHLNTGNIQNLDFLVSGIQVPVWFSNSVCFRGHFLFPISLDHFIKKHNYFLYFQHTRLVSYGICRTI